MPRIVIVGGGISGLALAFRLEQRLPEAQVQVLESRGRLGGTIATVERDGFRVEEGPNGFLDNNPATLDLCRELGLHDRLIPASEAAARNRYLFLDDRLRLLPRSLASFVTSDLVGWRTKWRLLTERWRRSTPPAGDESIDAFARRRANDEAAEKLADPFVTGIFAGDAALLSVRAAFPRLVAYEREHGSVLGGMAAARKRRQAEAAARGEKLPARGARMWSYPEGLGVLVDGLHRRLRTPPRVGVSVTALRRDGDGWSVVGDGGATWPADIVALTCPAWRQSELVAAIDPALAAEIVAIPYNRVAVVALGFRERDVPMPLEGFGYLTRGKARENALGVQWCSSIFPGRAPAGHVLLRAMCGGWFRGEMVDWDDDRLIEAVRRDLRKAMRLFAEPVFHHIVRWERAIPQYHLGHLERVARIEALASRHRGLLLGGNAYRGVALNDCVEQARKLAERIAQIHLEPRP
jgi:oxygen-dependent protoporphyrinogen oxidase